MRTRFSPVLVLALALSLLALPAKAAPLEQAESPRLLPRLVMLIKNLPGKLVSVWEKEGSAIDPFGGLGNKPPVQEGGLGGAAASGGESLEK